MQDNHPRWGVASALHLSDRPLTSWLFLAVGLLISAAAYFAGERLIEQEEQAHLNVRVEQGRSAIERHLDANFEVVRALQSHFMSSAVDDRRIFRDYHAALALEQRYPGLQALTFSRWLLPEQLPAFIARTRADQTLGTAGFPDFDVKPAGQRDFYCVVDLLEPLERNQKAFGFDLCSEPERRAMVERARDSGALTASAPLKLFVPDPGVSGFILALPVYRPGLALSNTEQRRRAFLGVVSGVYRYQEVIRGALGNAFLDEVEVQVLDLAPAGAASQGPPRLIFGASSAKAPAAERSIEIGGRRWQLGFTPRASFRSLADSWMPPLAAAVGLLFTAGVFTMLRLLPARSRRAMSQLRTLSRAVEQSPMAVVITDVAGRIEYVNPHYCQITGFAAEEVIGLTPRVHASGQTPREVYANLWATILAGRIWRGELLNRRKNGELYWDLEVIAPVFGIDGKVCNFVAIKEDITERKRAEAEVRRMNRTLRVLSRCNAVLVRAAGETELLESMCDVLAESGGYRLAWIGFPADDGALQVAAQRGFESPSLAAAIGAARWDDSLAGQGPSGRALRSAQVVVEHQFDGPDQAPWVIVRRETGIQSGAALPLLAGGKVLGVLSLFSTDADAFNAAEVELLTELADDLAYGIATQRGERERRAREDELRLMRRAIDASSDGIMVADHSRDGAPLVYVNSAFERITGFPAAEALGRNAGFLHAGDDEQSALAELANAIAGAREARVELRTQRKDGAPFWSELAVAPLRDAAGGVSHVVSVLTDITERKRWESQLEYQATHDALTDLPNRALLADRVDRAIAAARREQDCVALMLLDLDRFKLVNDSLGHEVGDSLLKMVAARLTGQLREGDTVARLGGDEFVVVANVRDEHGAAAVARALMKAIAEPLQIGTQPIFQTCSLGVALFPRDGDQLGTLMRNADAAMYRAKADGSGQPQFYAHELTVSTGRRLQLESALRQALERDELCLYYQPKVRLASGMLVGAEVLLRWQHPQYGMISPAEFIPIAEETGLIMPIGAWVLHETCRQIARWQALDLPAMPLAVNLSARQFAASDLVEQISLVLRDTGVDAALLQLELTESILMHRPEAAAQMLGQLRALGIKLALDDFGTGYSSLNYLRRFPINYLKIDQSFVRELVHDGDSATIALSTINLAHSLRMEVVAEGVENEAQLRFLQRNGCDQVQGYLTGRPMPAGEFQALLSRPVRMIGPADRTVPKRTLLLLDDEPSILSALRRIFSHEGYQLLMTSSPHEALELLALHQVDVILADQRMPAMSGTAFFRRVKLSYPNTVRMILSGYTDLETLAGAINEGAIYKFLTKPWDDEQLREQVRDAFRYHELIQDKLPDTTEA